MDADVVAKAVASLGTIAGFLFGGYKVWVNSRRAKARQPLQDYRELVADMRRELDEVRRDWMTDRDEFRRRLAEERATTNRQVGRLQEQLTRHVSRIDSMRRRIKYLTQLLREHAPHVEIDPEEDEDL